MATEYNGVGASEYTRYKQQHLNQILRTHLRICSGILKAHNGWANEQYHYFDLNAGPGIYLHDGEIIKGSPLVFLEEQKAIDMKCHGVFFEIDDSHRTRLIHNVADYADKPGLSFAFHGNHEKFLPCYFPSPQKRAKRVFGLVYSDPTGSNPPFELLQSMLECKCFSTLDVLLYFSATNYKRQLMAPACPLAERLNEVLGGINKKHWIVREPYGRHQWTFLIGTNWTKFPEFKQVGFHRIDRPEGEKILARLNYTNMEMRTNGDFGDFGHHHAPSI